MVHGKRVSLAHFDFHITFPLSQTMATWYRKSTLPVSSTNWPSLNLSEPNASTGISHAQRHLAQEIVRKFGLKVSIEQDNLKRAIEL